MTNESDVHDAQIVTACNDARRRVDAIDQEGQCNCSCHCGGLNSQGTCKQPCDVCVCLD